ncbi:MAG TPA: amidohydrolase family protein [Clostridia bacterium]|nr:amidohydrolase family protein [Clostridia bacterium]
MQIVDSHTHVDISEVFGWYDPPESIITLMEEAGISKAVIMSYVDAPVLNMDILNYVAACVRKYPDKLVGYARIHPGYGAEALKILSEAIGSLGFKGLKLHPESIVTHPYNQTALALIRKAGELNAPTLFHSGDECLSLPFQIGKCAEACHDSIIIMGHMGGFFHTEEAIYTAEKYENIYLDTSAMPYPEMVKKAVDRIGADRVLFGSDGPGCNPALEVKKVKLAGLSEKQFSKVMGENIVGILEKVSIP